MDHAEQVSQIKTLLARLDSDTNVDAGGLRRNPTSVYVDPDLARHEQRELFDRHPQIIGLSGDLPEPGSFVTIDDLGLPILATRDGDGTFRAFVNACRHRGVVVEGRSRGTARRFTCPFHSWTYDSGGALVGLPKADHFGEIDRDCHGLVELPAVEWHGILIVHPQVDGDIDVDGMLGQPLASELASWHLDELGHLGADRYDVACNWKLAMDTFGETYHFESLHANSLAASFHGNVQCYDTYGRNHRMLLCRRDIATLRDLPEESWEITVAALPVYWLFPNVQLLPFGTGCYLVRAYPDRERPGHHVSHITFYLRPEATADGEAAERFREIAQRFADVIRDEDYVAAAGQQATAESGRLETVVFGRNEPALHHYHNTYRAALGLDSLPLVERV